jgi:hypothetical protein
MISQYLRNHVQYRARLMREVMLVSYFVSFRHVENWLLIQHGEGDNSCDDLSDSSSDDERSGEDSDSEDDESSESSEEGEYDSDGDMEGWQVRQGRQKHKVNLKWLAYGFLLTQHTQSFYIRDPWYCNAMHPRFTIPSAPRKQ